MLRIVGLQRDECAEREFVLLQNQGSLKVCLRGHVLVSDSAISQGDLALGAFVFAEEENIPPGLYVHLSTASGLPHWARTRDGAHVYRAFMGMKGPVWERCEGPLHILCPQHAYSERAELLVLR